MGSHVLQKDVRRLSTVDPHTASIQAMPDMLGRGAPDSYHLLADVVLGDVVIVITNR